MSRAVSGLHSTSGNCEKCPGPVPGWYRARRSCEQHLELSLFCVGSEGTVLSTLCPPWSVEKWEQTPLDFPSSI